LSRVPLYDALAADYDRFVDWKGRLAHELPFLDRLFAGRGIERVLDAACGTGHHAIALAQRGYEVIGADLSAAMVERARQNAAAAGLDIRFTVAGLGELAVLGEAFDAVLCLGNSLPHLLTAAAVDGALADFTSVLRPGGLLVIQNRNFDRVWAERERFMPPQSHRDGEGEWLFVRFYDFHQETVTFHMIRLRRTEEGWAQDVESTELRPIFRDGLAAALVTAGFGGVAFYGGYDGSAFDPAQSGDLIAVARRN
jgi:glycine/sarcosine N-methyltransferase